MSRKTGKRRPKRTFVTAVIGLPESGKSTLIRRLLPMLKEADIVASSIAQDDPGDLITGFFKALVGGSARDVIPVVHRDTHSLIYRAIARVAHDKARHSMSDIVLLEHDPNFTWIMERYWAGVSAARLFQDFEKMTEPDLVLYLPASPDEVRSRGSSKVLQERGRLERVHRAMAGAALDKNWSQIVAPSGGLLSIDEAASVAFRELMNAYQYHLASPKVPKKFWMRGMKKKYPRGFRAMTAN